MARPWSLGMAFIAAISACGLVEPDASLPANASRIAPPAEFSAWYTRTETCAQLPGNFERIDWYVVPGVETFETEDGPKVGLWSRYEGRDRIVVAGNYLRHEMVIRHEILHQLLGRQGHPSEYFSERCRLTWTSWAE